MPILYFFLGILLACSSLDPRKHKGVDSEFWTYVQLFEIQADRDIGDVPVNFGSIEPNHAGECWQDGTIIGTYNEVVIDPQWWFDNPDPRKREMLISHELGHCVLGREHISDKHLGIPVSIMYPSIDGIDPAFFDTHRAYYYLELSTPLPSLPPISQRSNKNSKFLR